MSKVVSTPTATKMKVIWQNENVREFLAEFISTYVMMVFGLGAVAHMVLGGKLGSYLAVNLGFGFGVTIGIHMAGNISGAHMNAAVTFTSCALGRMSWKKFPVYVLGQFLGSFVAAATIYGLFYTAIIDFSGGKLMVTGPTATANIFATYLPDHMTLWRGFLDEVSGPGTGGPPQALPHSRRGQQAAPVVERTRTLDGTIESWLCHGGGWVGAAAEALGLGRGPQVLPRCLSPGGGDWDASAMSLSHHRQGEQPNAVGDTGHCDRHPYCHHRNIPGHELGICHQPIPGPASPLLHLPRWLGLTGLQNQGLVVGASGGTTPGCLLWCHHLPVLHWVQQPTGAPCPGESLDD
ncbi:uncharacterized protein LOC120866250 isoform X2 [Oryx dammah]|nr:uncharacterized protein LOC120860333 isoform X2 [Oryx dammah]XP_040092071.1 uncharacterized protein LOC120860333 isoform X2 [Oryx dammah]XP_040092072.1 uncharacterized protein LOC120860333 isoform X2 [Oryx dammah]XP_040099789.1 uncharacterized protein LOC120866250 isoform X2 [Oryx dammah]XP_040099797.1 uncharacterized protein LOC120866250 isoform X2 [Oryx dammah]XP_040099804.1 uncharacterized protein LOC120866250 isoform X2 [Oryx dammah]